MNKQVNIFGLGDKEELYQQFCLAGSLVGDVWTLNDWYQFHTWLKPDRVFNLHRYPHINLNIKRFTGDWKEQYNASGALVNTVESISGIERQEVIDEDKLIDFCSGREYLRCSISTMIYLAAMAGFQSINLYGVRLTLSEYKNQIWGITEAIKKVRAVGIALAVLPSGRESFWDEESEESINYFLGNNACDNNWCYWDSPKTTTRPSLTKKQLEVDTCHK